ncbi:MAG: alanine-glyoxylate transaminase / serine-glyoxylate transaminase / serine-pyruvate transaminase [Acetobacteraceae bacterium]|nr:alanine-glyoxylate transaminase / serine-glyoxylate transaminase / serine-pyruvate transaminase [Acetobacteraceae bacterium]
MEVRTTMTLRAGREFLAIPGPTTVPDEVLRAMHRPAVDIYAGPLLALTESLHRDIARVFQTQGRAYIYISNGHGAWEASLTNVLSKGDKILVLESGRFAVGWGENARRMGVEVEVLKGDMRHAVRPSKVEARLRADKGGTIRAILVAQIDTASGVVNDIAAISEARRAAGHEALLMVDAVASLGCMKFEMDKWSVDVAMAGSQKGLMMAPGLGFVAANDRAREAHRKADLRTPYWDWTDREGDAHYQKYAGTPPEHLLFGLRQALDLLFEEGMENAFRRHHLLAEATRHAVAVWAEGQALKFNIIAPRERSDTVSVVLTKGCDPDAMRAWCRENCGVVLGHGIGELSGKAFRVAHMGHVNAPMVLGMLSVIEMALAAMGIPHGSGGVQAAITWLARQVRDT